jgi:ribokinase
VKKPIVVIGSINMDLVCRTPHMPVGGETILGSEFVTIPGGKGANQAVAAAKLGGDVHMIGRVGDDDFGKRLLAGLATNGVNIDRVPITKGIASGVAMILVDAKGQNSIVVAPGANARVTTKDIDAARDLIASAAAVVMQLEIPLPVVKHAMALCKKLGVFTIVDPAPAVAKLPKEIFAADIFTPNESEAEILLGRSKDAAVMLLKRGAKAVVLKQGSRGATWFDRTGQVASAKAYKVKVVDTTAAGDSFTGGLAVAQAEGMSPADALRFACAAGAICCTGFGAQPSLPTRQQVDRMLKTKS